MEGLDWKGKELLLPYHSDFHMPQEYRERLDGILIRSADIQKRVTELREEIARDYSNPHGFFALCVLKGAFFFFSDLLRHSPHVPVEIDFIPASSYFGDQQQKLTISDFDITKITGLDVLVVEDIVDTGETMHSMIARLEQGIPHSIKIASLLNKPSRRKRNVHVDYIGFDIDDLWVVGYGLDNKNKYRELEDIAVLKKEYR